jgi:hypothetical protein
MKNAYQAALAGKALPEFDGVPIGPTVRLPSREIEQVERTVSAVPQRRRFAWGYLLLILILGVAVYGSYRLLSGLNVGTPSTSPEGAATVPAVLPTSISTATTRPMSRDHAISTSN